MRKAIIKKLIIINIIKLFFNLFPKYLCEKIECSVIYDCFNCVVNSHCKWDNKINLCGNYNESSPYAIKNPYGTNDVENIEIVSKFLLFIKNVCYSSYIPYFSNYNNYTYNELANKYCGQHLISIDENSSIKLKNIDGSYGFPNIVCEYLFEYCPGGYDAIINIKESYLNNITLIFHSDSQNLTEKLIKKPSSEIKLETGINTLSFTYYSTMSFPDVPFEINFINRMNDPSSQSIGILLLFFIIISLILIVSCIIYIRNTSKLLRPDILNYNCDEKEKIISTNNILKKKELIDNSIINNDNKNKVNSKILKKPIIPENLSNSNSYENSNNNTDAQLINDVCPLDNKIFLNESEIFKAPCGHLYHLKCYKDLVNTLTTSFGTDGLYCLLCAKRMYP